MNGMLLFALGLAVGVLAGWLWASSQARSVYAKQLQDMKARATVVADRLRAELGTQIDAKNSELSHLGAQLDEERESAAHARSRVEAAYQLAQKEKTLLTEATTKLTKSFKDLSSEFTNSANHGLIELAQFQDIAKHLDAAVTAYHRAVEEMESRVVAAKRRVKELGASIGQPQPPGEAVEQPAQVAPPPESEEPEVLHIRPRRH